MHEYTVIGHPRQRIIFFIALLSIVASNFITNYVDKWIGQHLNTTITFSLSSATIFGVLYVAFNNWWWRVECFQRIFHFPDLEGEWKCTGLSNNIALNQQFDWEGEVIIKQSWDKILVSLKTKNSSSSSISVTGGINYFPGFGYKLSYHYQNTPNASTEENLRKHEGYCILTFSEDKKSAEGCYFNNIKDRQSYGEMKLERKVK